MYGGIFLQLRRKLPSLASSDAVRDRKISAFLGLQIIRAVRVAGKEHSSFKGVNGLHHCGQNCGGLRGSECAVNKILLHVNYN